MQTQLNELVGEIVEILIEGNSYSGTLQETHPGRYNVRIHKYMTIHFYNFEVENIFSRQIVLE